MGHHDVASDSWPRELVKERQFPEQKTEKKQTSCLVWCKRKFL